MKNPLLSTEEKRRWLARVFRDEDGEYSQADKFKALVEDTKLAALQQEEEEFKRQREMGAAPQDPILALLQSLPPAELKQMFIRDRYRTYGRWPASGMPPQP